MSAIRSRGIFALLRQIAEQLECLTDDEIAGILSGRLKVRISVSGDDSREANLSRRTGGGGSDEQARVADTLRSIGTREEGYGILERACKTKADLLRLARYLDLHVPKEDDADRLRQRIIESTIGFRLRSEVVRGTPSGRGNSER